MATVPSTAGTAAAATGKELAGWETSGAGGGGVAAGGGAGGSGVAAGGGAGGSIGGDSGGHAGIPADSIVDFPLRKAVREPREQWYAGLA
jgi:hypothetical protein